MLNLLAMRVEWAGPRSSSTLGGGVGVGIGGDSTGAVVLELESSMVGGEGELEKWDGFAGAPQWMRCIRRKAS
jgi:hypothetical protein